MRNRIIAGLSLGTIVVEARKRSGALITARLSHGTDTAQVMAVPGQIDSPVSEGPLQLIRDGAAMITCPADVTDALGRVADEAGAYVRDRADAAQAAEEKTRFDPQRMRLNENETKICQAMDDGPCPCG